MHMCRCQCPCAHTHPWSEDTVWMFLEMNLVPRIASFSVRCKIWWRTPTTINNGWYTIQDQLRQGTGQSVYSEVTMLNLLWDSSRVLSESWGVGSGAWVLCLLLPFMGCRSLRHWLLLHYSPAEFSLARELPGTRLCLSANLSVALVLKRSFVNEVARTSTRYWWWFSVVYCMNGVSLS